MASVTGVTAERANEIEDASVVSATLAGNDLVLLTKGGTEINVGRIIPPAVNAWPIGSIFMNTLSTNPATLLGGGTWVRWGKGRVPVSLDEGQAEFDEAEEVGGFKTHTLQANEMPGHNHTYPGHNHSTAQHYHNMYHDHGAATTSTAGNHEHTSYGNTTAGQDVGTYARGAITGRVKDGSLIDGAGDHNHTFDVPAFDGNTGWGGGQNTGDSAGGTTSTVGGGAAHNNLQPYITCYMWKRTA